MGYEVVLYVTKDETTEKFFHRFQKVEIRDRVWEVQMVNDITSDTMLIVYLKETFTNEFDPVTNTTDDAETPDVNPVIDDITAAIVGYDTVYPFDKVSYEIENASGGSWILETSKAKIESQSESKINIIITSAKSGQFDLKYKINDEDIIVKTITIASL
jgi:DNA helicase HerA-like ATPase